MKKPILCVGDAFPDLILDKRIWETVHETTEEILSGSGWVKPHLKEIRLSGGGTVSNVAVSLARLGNPTAFLGRTGRDHFGRFMREHMEKNGVDTRYIVIDEEYPTALVIMLVDEKGDRDGCIYPLFGAANSKLCVGDFSEDLYDEIGFGYITGISLTEEPSGQATLHFVRKCREKGIPVAMDLNMRTNVHGWNKKMKDAFLEAVEGCSLLFGSVPDEWDILAAPHPLVHLIDDLIAKGKTVVCKEGPRGASLFTKGERLRIPAFPVKVADTVGAGDVFNSGYLTAHLEGKDLGECLLWGSAAAGYSIQFHGAGNCPTREQLQKMISKYALNEERV